MNIVTAKAVHTVRAHCALNEIVPLHPILVGGTVCKVRKALHAELVFLELPIIVEIFSDVETHGPVIISRRDRLLRGWP